MLVFDVTASLRPGLLILPGGQIFKILFGISLRWDHAGRHDLKPCITDSTSTNRLLLEN